MSDLDKLSKLMAQELNGTPQWQWADYIKRRLEKQRELHALIAENAPENLKGGMFGGPAMCEYLCSDVIAKAIRATQPEYTSETAEDNNGGPDAA